jgi:hypothetical protein
MRRIIEKVVGHHQIVDYKLQRDASYICLWSKTRDRPDISVRHKIKLDDYYYFFLIVMIEFQSITSVT